MENVNGPPMDEKQNVKQLLKWKQRERRAEWELDGGWARGWRRNRQEGEGRRWHWTECIEQGERYGTNDRMRAPRYALALLAPTTDARLVSSSFPVTFSSRIRWRQNACRALPTGCWQYPRERDLILCLFLHRQGFFFFSPEEISRCIIIINPFVRC